jgi:hypothetical protein
VRIFFLFKEPPQQEQTAPAARQLLSGLRVLVVDDGSRPDADLSRKQYFGKPLKWFRAAERELDRNLKVGENERVEFLKQFDFSLVAEKQR